MSDFEINPVTGELDLVTSDLNLIPIGNKTTYFKWVEPDTLELYVNGVMRQSWTTAYVAPELTGQPMGLLLTLTYSA